MKSEAKSILVNTSNSLDIYAIQFPPFTLTLSTLLFWFLFAFVMPEAVLRQNYVNHQ